MKKETKKSSKDSKVKGLSFGHGKEVSDKNGPWFRLRKTSVEVVGRTDSVHYVIPAEIDGYPVRSIKEKAFEWCRKLKSIVIPNSVTRIESFAFNRCAGLTSVTIGDGLKFIDSFVFEECGALESITVSEGNPNFMSVDGLLLSKDGKTLIKGINRDVTIPDGVTSILDGAFRRCKNLTKIIIPDSVANIGKQAFQECEELKCVTLSASLKSIGSHAFHGCKKLKNIILPNAITDIGEFAFYDTAIDKITIPASVKSIGGKTFCSHCGVKSIAVEEVNAKYKVASGLLLTKDGKTLIMAQSNLSNVTIPDGVNCITLGAFQNCTSLKSVKIPDTVKIIGSYAFGYCSSLTSVTIPNSVKELGTGAFAHCERLKTLSLPKHLEEEIESGSEE